MSFKSRFEHIDRRVPIAEDNIAIFHDISKCKNCTLCRRACALDQEILDYYDLESTGDNPICIQCGQCTVACPFDSMHARHNIEEVKKAVADPDKIVMVQTAPAIRVSIGEMFGHEPGEFLAGKMIGALRALGVDYVFDTNFGADLTVMEESNELLQRLKNKDSVIPQFTSCCPGWVNYCEIYFPEFIPNLSSTRSPIPLASTAAKTYFAKKMNIDPEKIVMVVIAPCTAKKHEIHWPDQHKAAEYWGKPESDMLDTDYCLTTREFAYWMKDEGVDFDAVEDSDFDKFLGEASGGGVIFGNTGGVMQATLRNAYHTLTGEKPEEPLLHLENLRGLEGVKEADITIGDYDLHVAVVQGGKSIRSFLNGLKSGENKTHYDFVEFMACKGGCIGGGGQPRVKLPMADKTREARIAGLYKEDDSMTIRTSCENPEIQEIYKEFYGHPLSELAKKLQHTTFRDRSGELGPRKDVTPETCPTSPKYKKPE